MSSRWKGKGGVFKVQGEGKGVVFKVKRKGGVFKGKGMGADCTSFIAVNNRYFN